MEECVALKLVYTPFSSDGAFPEFFGIGVVDNDASSSRHDSEIHDDIHMHFEIDEH